jgi:hypothetical protein
MNKKEKPNERSFYEPIKEWLESKGYKAVISAGKRQIYLPTGALLGVSFLEPDVIGYKEEDNLNRLTIVEAKTDPMFLFDGLGRCFVYETVANHVYLAVPKDVAEKIGTRSLYEDLKVGVLAVDPETKEIEEKVKAKEIYPARHDLREILLKMLKSTLKIRE